MSSDIREDGALVDVDRPKGGECLSMYDLTRIDERDKCATRIEGLAQNMPELLLRMGEITAQERRSVRAALILAATILRGTQ